VESIDYNGKLVFVGDDYIHGSELWISDGTEAGTKLIKDIWPGAVGSMPNGMKVINDIVYFSASDELHGTEIWRTDGTENGTFMVGEVNPGGESSNPSDYYNVNDTIIFKATSSVYGRELFRYIAIPNIKITYSGASVAKDSTVDLGSTIIGSTSEYNFYIENKGCKDLNLTGTPVIEYVQDSIVFTGTEPGQTQINPGGNIPFKIIYTPKSAGTRNMAITLKCDDPEQNSFTFYVKASGNIPTGLNQKKEEDIEVYPNPVNDKLIINTSLKGNYILYNEQGMIVTSGKINKPIIDLSNIKSGFYILSIELEKQTKIIKKIIKISK
jgi:ELWxxDGT repeat protein